MLRLRGTFDGEYISFDLAASMAKLEQLLGEHLDRRYPGDHVTVTVCLHPTVRGHCSGRHEEYVYAAVWEGRQWIVWEAPDATREPEAAPAVEGVSLGAREGL